ncbi:RNA chaperone Hfq [Staphylococcus gallinarum]|jgi:host factor-I protein|uniref:RNA-binding protein Hfq n=1 Tax=Staphylococcus gallinarum TaxID=1293 RepID=A0A0D0RPV7_STAGA|nr:RNA chaperone Hfq [Staphylococcus gallinarum]KIR12002.1 RNA-binding protein [Staphylococcus gallinarum]MBU7216359.1 RNA chaperone Hfq [Staphylococcus gallinarum]MCD8786061.1 RNA chaperone Hfq [Staphylococcus gallinarum]MCD8793078.1 RNA chaperone Hfq [Staphylococcus gallinarum]MCD8820313.1 RNA chaperone Hfq [Staphylococcus gallinarum]
MNTTENIQDKFLGQFKAEETKVIVFLVNGFQMKGTIVDFDKYLVCLLSQGKEHMIYKHAISTFTIDDSEE